MIYQQQRKTKTREHNGIRIYIRKKLPLAFNFINSYEIAS